MAADVRIRPLTGDDVTAADALAWDALLPMVPHEFRPDDERQRARRGQARIAHLIGTDPGGCWAAEGPDGLHGICLALLREDVWGLSLFAVAAANQGQGLGRRLLDRALAYGDGGRRGAIILSSTDPRAMRSYHRAGFDLRPTVALSGPLNASRIPDGLRSVPADPEADRAVLDRASRHVRGASHAGDVESSVGVGYALLAYEDRGFALHAEGSVALLAAVDEEAATDLLWSCLAAGTPGATVGLDFVTAGQDWAVRAGLDAGLALSPDGPMFTRGALGTLSPYLPSGAWL